MRYCGFGFGRRHERADGTGETRAWWSQPQTTSGNRAFYEYRAETLRRLEQEQHEFHDFLARLRGAKDKTEFDQFMAERRAPANGSTA